jgi:threonine dehydrogenase-like Zn-dependent dehydrogenase
MRQILLSEPGHFVDRQVPLPATAEGEALVRIRRVGICGSDFHAFNGVLPAYTFPRVIGHEIGCEVVEVAGNGNGSASAFITGQVIFVDGGWMATF